MQKILILLVILLLSTGLAGAQDIPPTFCADLSDADCAILTESAAAMRGLESAAFQFEMDFAIGDFPETKPTSISFRLAGHGAYAIEPGVLNTLTMSPSELMGNMGQLTQITQDTLKGISGDVTLLLIFPQEMVQAASEDGTHLPEKLGLSLRLVDGVGYINLDKLAELDTEGTMPRGWWGLNLTEFIGQVLAQSGLENSFSMPGLDSESLSAFTDPDFMGSFTSIERRSDIDIDGQAAAIFETSIDLGALYASPAFQAMLRDQLETSMEAMSDEGISDDDFDGIMELYATLFDGFVIGITQTIGLDDNYVHQMNMALDWSIDLSQMLEGLAGSDAVASSPPIHISFGFDGRLNQFNNAPVITAPEGAQMIPLDELFGQDNPFGALRT